ncbi:chemotaxis protein CheA [Paraferrimonas sp. SM1919]|uniref:chemotaxis protein CheA n=1 Tax=Paraferrimonas sp. SM1919 TaxID=2662263 RepID=UPI0013D266AD|nr:chemotaxis protein CheA [Paraferrimonas sp. SM1919]
MVDNNKQFEQIFFEEMSEHLQEMESLLLDTDNQRDNIELLDALFRAAHSIKGGSAIFGFDDIATVTHTLEHFLSSIKNKKIKINQAMIELLLQAKDILQSLKQAHQNDASGNVSENKINTLCDSLRQFFANEEPTNEIINHDFAAINILIVEDSAVNQKLATHILKKIGIKNYALAENGQVALASLQDAQQQPFDIILLDCHMPVLNGYQTSMAIRNGEAGEAVKTIPIIAMTAMIGEQEKQKCLDAGMDDYLVKPMKVETAKQKIWHWYGQSKQPESLLSSIEHGDSSQVNLPSKDSPVFKVQESTSIRVSTHKIDELINQVGELIITQSMLQNLIVDLGLDNHELLTSRIHQLEGNTRELQASVMSVRMMPIGTLFKRFPRVVRDLSQSMNKQINLIIEGEDTELDKGLLEKLVDPLTHLVRNSIDHGIEMPEQRQTLAKSEQGIIKLIAMYRGGDVVINIEDDGAGIDPRKILDKAQKLGLSIPESQQEQDIFQLIFSPGFSTAESVTEVSGRGVGMDVVKRNITALGGRIEISSIINKGTTISIRMPLTLAIIEGMSVAVGEQTYIIPLTYIIESLQPNSTEIKQLNSHHSLIKVQGSYVPILRLDRFFNIESQYSKPQDGIIVLLEHGDQMVALLVDRLLGQQQIVVKNIVDNYKKLPCISGATIMGDGRVSLILDVADLVKTAKC